MKVICIDAGFKKNSGRGGGSAEQLVEGQIYTVVRVIPPVIDEYGYVLAEVTSNAPYGAFLSSRFAPLSDINETTFERNYQTQTA